MAQAIRGSVGSYDSPFEEAVANGLRRKGWQVIPQIGVSRFRIDLGIVHPDKPGDYLVGVECDGATYHSAATARDRDKVRSSILHGLGWKLLRQWSTEWWIDKEGALERLDFAINHLLEVSRAEEAVRVSEAEAAVRAEEEILLQTQISQDVVSADEPDAANFNAPVANDEEIAVPIESTKLAVEENDSAVTLVPAIKYASSAVPDSANASTVGKYKINDLQGWMSKTNAELFYDPDYNETLNDLIESVVKAESPVLATTLIQRIARVHGFNRAGRLIRERVMEVVDKRYHVATDHYGEDFVWLSAAQRADWNAYRLPATEHDIRLVDAIPSEELRALVLDIGGENKIADMAKSLGIKRLTTQARHKLESLP